MCAVTVELTITGIPWRISIERGQGLDTDGQPAEAYFWDTVRSEGESGARFDMAAWATPRDALNAAVATLAAQHSPPKGEKPA